MTYLQELTQHYAAVRNRLGRPPPATPIVRRLPPPPAPAPLQMVEAVLERTAPVTAVTPEEKIAASLQLTREIIARTPGLRKTAAARDAVVKVYGLTREELLSADRHRSVVVPRMVAMAISREIFRVSCPQIGHDFGGRDHTTVINAVMRFGSIIRSLASSVQPQSEKITP